MCGIIGFIADSAPNAASRETRERLFWMLRSMFVSVCTRGQDAGGFCGITPQGDVVYNRAAGPLHKIPHLMESAMDSKVFIAHARLATHGKPENNFNNHPFLSRDGRYALIHNGVINNYNGFSRTSQGECDSEVIIHQIAQAGSKTLAKKIKKGIGPLRGTMACALLDTQNPNVLYLFRSNGGGASPLCTIGIEGGLLFASEWQMLYQALTLAEVPSVGSLVREDDDTLLVVTSPSGTIRRTALDKQRGWNSSGYQSSSQSKGYYQGVSATRLTNPLLTDGTRSSDISPGYRVNVFVRKAPTAPETGTPYRTIQFQNAQFVPRRSLLDDSGLAVMSITGIGTPTPRFLTEGLT